MCVNGWSVEHDERNRKAQKYCFMDVRAPSPTPNYSILCHMPRQCIREGRCHRALTWALSVLFSRWATEECQQLSGTILCSCPASIL